MESKAKSKLRSSPDFILLAVFALSAFITRVINLLKVPLFTDEAIYIRWAQIGFADPAHRFISLSDGKQPLLTWIMYIFLPFFNDPLIAGRLVSVFSSVLAITGIYLIARLLFNRRTAVFSSILYLFSQFSLVYDRLALMDSLLAAISIWSIYLQIILVKHLRLDTSLILGIVIGLGLLTKSSAMFSVYLMPFSLILFGFNEKNNVKRLVRWALLALLSIIISQIMANTLRLSPLYYIIEQKNYSFILTIPELLNRPFRDIVPNFHGLLSFLIEYFTIPLIILITAGIFLSIIKKNVKIIYLSFWFIIPFFALGVFGKVLFPRFILFMTMPLLVVAGFQLSEVFSLFKIKRILSHLFILLILILPVYNSLVLILNPVKSKIPKTDRNQLFDDWPSGYGVNEVINFLKKEAENKTVVIGTEGTFGLNPAVYEIYLKKNPNIIVRGYWPVNEIPEELREFSKIHPTYLVFKEKQSFEGNWNMKLISKYRRGLGSTYLYFFQVLPDNVKT